jgi:uncharacterized protein (DUF433 family)
MVDRPVSGPRPVLAGTRLEVRHIVEVVHELGGSEAAAVAFLEIDPAVVAEAMRYYDEHRAQVDAWIREEDESSERAYRLWREEQQKGTPS